MVETWEESMGEREAVEEEEVVAAVVAKDVPEGMPGTSL